MSKENKQQFNFDFLHQLNHELNETKQSDLALHHDETKINETNETNGTKTNGTKTEKMEDTTSNPINDVSLNELLTQENEINQNIINNKEISHHEFAQNKQQTETIISNAYFKPISSHELFLNCLKEIRQSIISHTLYYFMYALRDYRYSQFYQVTKSLIDLKQQTDNRLTLDWDEKSTELLIDYSFKIFSNLQLLNLNFSNDDDFFNKNQTALKNLYEVIHYLSLVLLRKMNNHLIVINTLFSWDEFLVVLKQEYPTWSKLSYFSDNTTKKSNVVNYIENTLNVNYISEWFKDNSNILNELNWKNVNGQYETINKRYDFTLLYYNLGLYNYCLNHQTSLSTNLKNYAYNDFKQIDRTVLKATTLLNWNCPLLNFYYDKTNQNILNLAHHNFSIKVLVDETSNFDYSTNYTDFLAQCDLKVYTNTINHNTKYHTLTLKSIYGLVESTDNQQDLVYQITSYNSMIINTSHVLFLQDNQTDLKVLNYFSTFNTNNATINSINQNLNLALDETKKQNLEKEKIALNNANLCLNAKNSIISLTSLYDFANQLVNDFALKNKI